MVGSLIRTRRERLGLSQVELGRRVGMHQNVISRLERGSVELPQRITLDKLGAALGITLPEFYRAAGVLEAMIDPEPPAAPLMSDDAILADLWAQFVELAPPEALDMLRQMKEQETPAVYAQALRVIVEAFVAAAQIGGTIRRLPKSERR